MSKKSTKVTPLEFQIMKEIWNQEHMCVRDVQQALRGRRPLAYTTVMTLMDKLHHKGVLRRQRNGKAFVYSAAVEESEVLAEVVGAFCNAFFEGSRSQLRRYLGGDSGKVIPEEPAEPAAAGVVEDIEVELL